MNLDQRIGNNNCHPLEEVVDAGPPIVQMRWQRRPLVSITLKITHDEPVLLDAPGETCFPPLWGSVGILRSSLQSRGDCGRKTARRSTDAEQIGSSRLGAPPCSQLL